MIITSSSGRARLLVSRRLVTMLVCAATVLLLAQSTSAIADAGAVPSPSAAESDSGAGADQSTQSELNGSKADASATLQQCVTTGAQTERSATFAGEMKAIPGSARMQMSIALIERLPEEQLYHTVSGPGLGQWQGSASSVKVYTHIQQVTNLAAPALYRGEVRFRWLNAKGHVIKIEELRTPRCEQPAVAPTSSTTPTTTGQSSAS